MIFKYNWEKYNSKYLRAIIKLKKDLPFFLYNLKSDLLKYKFNIYFFNKKLPPKILSQVLFHLFVNSNEFGKTVSYAYYKNKKLVYPLPSNWLNIIKKKIKVSSLQSNLYFFITVFLQLIKDYLKNLIIILSFKRNLKKDILYFQDIPSDISLVNKPREFNFFNSFKKIINFKKKIIIHNNPNLDFFFYNNKKISRRKFCKNYLFISNSIIYKSYFFLYLNFLFIISFILIFLNKYSYSLLFDDFMKTLFLKSNKNLNITCFFNSSSGVRRPLWTYKKFVSNIKAYFYFYSANTATNKLSKKLKLKQKKNSKNYFSLFSWDNYLASYNEQIENIKNNLDKYDYKFENIGSIPFEGNKLFSVNKNKGELVVSIFDVSVYRPRFILFEQLPYYYYTYKNLNKFYLDIFGALEKSDLKWKIFVKRKRPFTKQQRSLQNKSFLKFQNLSVLKSNKNINIIDEGVNANSVVSNSNLVISMPYTTPSFLAKEYGVPTFFYDSSASLSDHILHKNIPLISSKKVMTNHIKKIFK